MQVENNIADATTGAISLISVPGRKTARGGTLLVSTLKNVVWISLVVHVVLCGLFNEFFFTIFNMQNIMVQAAVLGMLGLAMCLPLLVAGIDLSIHAYMGVYSAAGAIAMTRLGLPCWVGPLLGVAEATAVGFIDGLCITRLKMESLIQTLSKMIILESALPVTTRG